MRVVFNLLVLLLSSWLSSADASNWARDANQCDADDCARAATGTFKGLQSERLASCSSFQACTVTPPTTTVLVTSTVKATQSKVFVTTTVTTVTNVEVFNRTVKVFGKRATTGAPTWKTNCPTAVPTTASYCSGTSRYASACSCAGVTRSYTTLKTPTVTSTTTVTQTPPPVTKTVKATAYRNLTTTAVSTVTVSPETAGFALQLSGAHPYDGYYLSLFRRGRGDPGPLPVEASTMLDSETGTFTLDNQTHLNDYGFVNAIDGRQGSSMFQFTQTNPTPQGFTSPSCQINRSGSSRTLSCTLGDRRTFYICAPGVLVSFPDLPLLELGSSVNVDNCFPTIVNVVVSQF